MLLTRKDLERNRIAKGKFAMREESGKTEELSWKRAACPSKVHKMHRDANKRR